jgi:hypothetical protein
LEWRKARRDSGHLELRRLEAVEERSSGICPLDANRIENCNLFRKAQLGELPAVRKEIGFASPTGVCPACQAGLSGKGLKGRCADPNKNHIFGHFGYLQNKARQGIVNYSLRIARCLPLPE